MLYRFQLDAESNRLAFTHPQDRSDFDTHWGEVLADPDVTARAIVFNDSLAGSISCFLAEGLHHIGYWIARPFWGRGIATQALRLLLDELPHRPLYSRVAEFNAGSIRVLDKNGFVEIGREWSPETDRYVACHEVVMKLAD